MADKLLRHENDQFIHHDNVIFSKNIAIGIQYPDTSEIPEDYIPISLDIRGTDAISIPQGNDGDRPNVTGVPMFRYNTHLLEFEVYYPELAQWVTLSDDRELDDLYAAVLRNTNNITTLSGETALAIEQLDERITTNSDDITAHGLRLDILEYVDIDITALNANITIIEFDIPTANYALQFTWHINKVPTTNELKSQVYGDVTLSNTQTGSVSDSYTLGGNSTGAEIHRLWTASATSVSGPLNSADTFNRYIYWVYPYYYGTSANDMSSITIGELIKNVSRRGTKTFPIHADSEYIYFGYPATYPDLVSIVDGNGYDVFDSFSKYIVPVIGQSGESIDYKLYKTDGRKGTDLNYTFN